MHSKNKFRLAIDVFCFSIFLFSYITLLLEWVFVDYSPLNYYPVNLKLLISFSIIKLLMGLILVTNFDNLPKIYVLSKLGIFFAWMSISAIIRISSLLDHYLIYQYSNELMILSDSLIVLVPFSLALSSITGMFYYYGGMLRPPE